jgi:hypothetical protein
MRFSVVIPRTEVAKVARKTIYLSTGTLAQNPRILSCQILSAIDVFFQRCVFYIYPCTIYTIDNIAIYKFLGNIRAGSSYFKLTLRTV